MKFAILTDSHLGPEGYYKGVLRRISKDVKIYLDDFVDEMNNNVKPEFVIILGDLVNDMDKETDINNIDYIVKTLKKLKCPVNYVAGNHDLKNISEDELRKLFNQKSLYYSFDSGSLHFIILFSRVSEDRTIWIPDKQKEWLKQDLNKTDKKTTVFVHHGLDDQDLTGNHWFEGRPENCLIANRKEIRDIFSSSNKVIASFNSHLHWDKQDIHDNIPYFTIQSLTENEDDKGIASETHAVVNIKENKVNVDIKGNYSKKFSHQK
jgi:DNA repair exonuclease SbcCD nuclease subunit